MSNLKEKFFRRGNEFLGSKVPVICGAMTWISEPRLVSAVCNAGAFASLAGGNCPPEILDASRISGGQLPPARLAKAPALHTAETRRGSLIQVIAPQITGTLLPRNSLPRRKNFSFKLLICFLCCCLLLLFPLTHWHYSKTFRAFSCFSLLKTFFTRSAVSP